MEATEESRLSSGLSSQLVNGRTESHPRSSYCREVTQFIKRSRDQGWGIQSYCQRDVLKSGCRKREGEREREEREAEREEEAERGIEGRERRAREERDREIDREKERGERKGGGPKIYLVRGKLNLL